MNLKETLKLLCEPEGVAGSEKTAAKTAEKLLREYIPNTEIDNFGTVTGIINHDESLPLLLLDAHIDEIGMIVNFIDEKGFLKVGRAGGVDRRALPAATVTIHAEKPLKGVVCTLPPHVKKEEDKTLKEEDIIIDCGLTGEQARTLISLGDPVTVDVEFTELKNKMVNARALDDRAGVCAILYALDLLKDKKLRFNLAVSFSSQEELGLRGAAIAAYNINPDLAIEVDVSYGDFPKCEENKTGRLGEGVMLGVAPTLDRGFFEELKTIAKNKSIPFQIEVMGGKTSTNTDIISISRGGVKCALLSLPLRNMHTPAEVVCLQDIESAGRLIAAYCMEVKNA
ncbi:MAG: M42 family peptidase [Oscillospiraceae bacterium]|nr:M42 family peptidase [Oscillospiraceae bacterium]